MKQIVYVFLLVCMISCGQTKEKTEDAEMTSKPDKSAQVKETEKTDFVATETKYVYVDPDDSEDIDELREALASAYATIEELEGKVENAQMAIDDARSRIRKAQMDIEDARMMRQPMLLDDAEMGLMWADSDLDDAEAELW